MARKRHLASTARGLLCFCLMTLVTTGLIRSIRPIRVRIETSRGQVFIYVYRLGEDGYLKNEGNGMLSVWVLRARSYKTKAEV